LSIVVGLPEHAERLLVGHLHLPIAVYTIPPWSSPCSPMEFALLTKGAYGRTRTLFLAQPPPPRVQVPLATRMGITVYVGATTTIVPRDFLIAPGQGWSSRTGSCHVGQQEGGSSQHGLGETRGTWRLYPHGDSLRRIARPVPPVLGL
jgi:hypothetical protein